MTKEKLIQTNCFGKIFTYFNFFVLSVHVSRRIQLWHSITGNILCHMVQYCVFKQKVLLQRQFTVGQIWLQTLLSLHEAYNIVQRYDLELYMTFSQYLYFQLLGENMIRLHAKSKQICAICFRSLLRYKQKMCFNIRDKIIYCSLFSLIIPELC